MVTVKTDVMLSNPLLERIDAAVCEMNISRRLLYAMALESFIQRHQNRRRPEPVNLSDQYELDEDEVMRLRLMRRLYRNVLEEDE
jgi:hypothetical protein